uniref:hypothetical protein n=1 Tax=Dissulfurimicrobium sp. TaxID=2022436 RepID=UPI00404B1286
MGVFFVFFGFKAMRKACLFVAERKGDGAWLRLVVLKGGRNPVFGGVEEIGGDAPVKTGELSLVVHSRQTYILYEVFPNVKRDLLILQINDRLRQSGLLAERAGGLAHCIRPVAGHDGRSLYSILSLPKDDLEPFLAFGLRKAVRLRAVTSAVAAISAFLGVITHEPVLAACFLDDGLELIAAQNGLPVYLQFVPPGPEGRFDGAMIANTFDIVLQTIRRVHEIEIKRIVILGPNSHLYPETAGEYNIWTPDWGAFFKTDQPSLIPLYPALFGAYFIDSAFDFVPASWRLSRSIQVASQWMAVAAGVGGIIFFTAGLYVDKIINARLQFEMAARKEAVIQERDALQKMLPKSSEMTSLQMFVDLMARYDRQPRLDAMMLALTQALPEGVSISELKIERGQAQGNGVQAQAAQQAPVQTQTQGGVSQETPGSGIQGLLDRPLEIKLGLFASGDYGQCRDRFNRAAKAIQCGGMFTIQDIRWEYDEKAGQGRFSCLLLWKGGVT